MTKKLHVIHIPKCGGLSLNVLGHILNKNEIPSHTADNNINWMGVDNYSFVSWHFGATFIEQPETDFACILRDPLDRSISNFLWLYMHGIFTYKDQYSSLPTMLDKLKYYLFEDENYTYHKNVQTKFLSNKVSDFYYETIYLKNGFNEIPVDEKNYLISPENKTKNWYLEDTNTSLELAKINLDRCSIIGVVDEHSKFIDQLFAWILENWGLDLKDEFNNYVDLEKQQKAVPYYNYSKVLNTETFEVTTTQSLKALLTQEEIDRIYDNNSLDLELYNYAKAKLQ
jgi:hypothetical protein